MTILDLSKLRTVAMRDRDLVRLHGVHPHLVDAVTRILNAMEMLGYPMMVTAGLRTDEQQGLLYAQGRTVPGAVVTHLDGVLKKSMHQEQSDGFGHAVDCAFIDDPETVRVETFDIEQPWDVYGVMGEHFKCTWGGRWKTLADRPHLELSLTAKL